VLSYFTKIIAEKVRNKRFSSEIIIVLNGGLIHLKVEMKSISPLSNGSKDNPQADFDNPHLH